MEISMHRIVARIPSMLNIRVIDGLVATTAWTRLPVAGVPIDGAPTCRVLDASGFSKTFQWSNERPGSSVKQQQGLDLLFSPDIGTGFTILRNIIGSSPDHAADHVPTIEPHSPGLPSATPTFVWGSLDQTQRSGVTQTNADARARQGT
jgi:glucuronoarabinoxylan endo-1,4-beta-xylanase